MYHEMEKTFKLFLNDFESLHRSAMNGSSNKLFTDQAEKHAVATFSKLRKDKEVDSTVLSKISTYALEKAKSLWEGVYRDSVFAPFIDYTCDLYGIPPRSFSSFPTNFSLSKVPTEHRHTAYKPAELTKEDKHRDNSAKSKVN